MRTPLQQFLHSFPFLSEQEIMAFVKSGIRKITAPKEVLFFGAEPCTKVWFVEQGLFRTYRIVNGEDMTFRFFLSGELLTDYQSYLTNTPATLSVQSITEGATIIFEKEDILNIFDAYPRAERVGRIMAEQTYLYIVERLKQFQVDDLETRYQKLIASAPELFQSVPLHYISSFLGVKPQSLSRIRRKISRQKPE